MKILLDTTNAEIVKKYSDLNMIDGVTTNPSLIATSGKTLFQCAKDLTSATSLDVSVQVEADAYDKMIQEGSKIIEIAPNIILKLPSTKDGILACSHFADRGIKVNMTLCFSVNQAILCAKAGAYYISPFIGRLEDLGIDGMQNAILINTALRNYAFDTEVLGSSVRTINHINDLAIAGFDAVTISPELYEKMFSNTLADIGLEKFMNDKLKAGSC
jgi:transaldolase